MYTITIELPKSQVAMLAKKGATLVDQGGKYYSMNATTCKNSNDGSSKNNFNGEINPPYILNTLSSCNNEDVYSARPSTIFGLTHVIVGS